MKTGKKQPSSTSLEQNEGEHFQPPFSLCNYLKQIKDNFFAGKYDSPITRIMGALTLSAGITLLTAVSALVPGIVLVVLGAIMLCIGFPERRAD